MEDVFAALLYMLQTKDREQRSCKDLAEEAGKAVLVPIQDFQELAKAIDIYEGRTIKPLLFEKKDTAKRIIIPSGASLILLEVEGSSIHFLKDEGDKVGRREKIMLVLTGKREVRVVKSPREGFIISVFTLSHSHPEKYLVVIVGVDDACEL